MHKIVSLPLLSLFLIGACSTTDTAKIPPKEQVKYIDLTADDNHKLLEKYWVSKIRREPIYPIDAAKKGLSGCVDFIVGINSNGKLSTYKVHQSYPQGVFDEYALVALSKWRWEAAENNHDKQPVLTTIQMDFMIQGSTNKIDANSHCGYSHI
ncbi:energy transducer TonB [Pseudoalteromonas sp. T1lg23B]|uniref:energy transducer TonB n=1 Tax=Pseudoalteromonas sp. T1lg23B TaxID=2077097 RepID=UPI000CF61CC6|nr:energy transducer TonB [Pseudoalteromonas sp. T1lg23B]